MWMRAWTSTRPQGSALQGKSKGRMSVSPACGSHAVLVTGPWNYLNKTLEKWIWMAFFFRKKHLQGLACRLYPFPSFWSVVLCVKYIRYILGFSGKRFIILDTGCHWSHVTHGYFWITNFSPSQGNVCKFSLNTYIWHASGALLISVFLSRLLCVQLGPVCVRITALDVMLPIQVNSIVLQLKMLRLRTGQDVQRSLVWLGEAMTLCLVSWVPTQCSLHSAHAQIFIFPWTYQFGAGGPARYSL